MKEQNNLVNYKSVNEFTVDQESRKVSGYLAWFDNKDLQSDVIKKGAFTKSLQEHGIGSTSPQKIAFLWMHKMDEPIGRFTVLIEDDKGLYFEADIDEIEQGDRALKQYASGTLNQHSIGYKYIWDKTEYDSETDTYYLYEVKLLEGSVVTIGANENTPFTGFKSGDGKNDIESIKNEFETAVKKIDSKAVEIQMRKLFAGIFTLEQNEPIEKPLEQQAEEKPESKSIIFLRELNKSIKP